MKKMNEITVSVVPCSARPIIFDAEKCIGCNTCAKMCQCDVLLPSTEKGQHPIVAPNSWKPSPTPTRNSTVSDDVRRSRSRTR